MNSVNEQWPLGVWGTIRKTNNFFQMTCDHSPFYEALDSEAAVMVFKNPDFREAAKKTFFLGIIPELVNRHPLGTFRILLSLFAEKVVFF